MGNLRHLVAGVGRLLVAALGLLGRFAGELLVAVAILGGWALLTWGIARLVVPEVWPISGGLLLLSLAGWKFCWTLVREGLYVLTRKGVARG